MYLLTVFGEKSLAVLLYENWKLLTIQFITSFLPVEM